VAWAVRITGQQRGGLLVRTRLPQPLQQAGHATRVAERGVLGSPGGAVGQRGGLLVRARLPQPFQQVGHGVRVVERGMGGRVTGQQRGGLPGRLVAITLAAHAGGAFGADQVLLTHGLSSSGVSSGPCVSSV